MAETDSMARRTIDPEKERRVAAMLDEFAGRIGDVMREVELPYANDTWFALSRIRGACRDLSARLMCEE